MYKQYLVDTYIQHLKVKSSLQFLANSQDKENGDSIYSLISYSALDKCDPRPAGRAEVMGPNCSQSHSLMLSNFQSD